MIVTLLIFINSNQLKILTKLLHLMVSVQQPVEKDSRQGKLFALDQEANICLIMHAVDWFDLLLSRPAADLPVTHA